uniref:Uncharacterized protein n=1 Tax=Triticum urartu TaxID=4572 RepID=A0A8R7U804_TRIUA
MRDRPSEISYRRHNAPASLLRSVLLLGLQRAWTTVWKKEMPSLTVVVFGVLLPFF